jgi:hypothetical protein
LSGCLKHLGSHNGRDSQLIEALVGQRTEGFEVDPMSLEHASVLTESAGFKPPAYVEAQERLPSSQRQRIVSSSAIAQLHIALQRRTLPSTCES